MNAVAHESKTDVLIIGAGPAGLLLAIELARRGRAFRIIDQLAERSPLSKAMALHPRTLEALDLVDPQLVATFVRHGYIDPGIASGSTNSVRGGMYRLDTRFPFTLIIPQAETEGLLEGHLTTLGASVERGKRLVSFTQQDGKVTASVVTDTITEIIQARYAIGCDGAHSTTRHKLGLPFEGKGYSWTAFLGDVQIEGERAAEGIVQFTGPRGLGMIIPFRNGIFRVITIDSAYQQPPQSDDLSLAELQDSVNAIIPGHRVLSEPRWLARWGAQLRQVSQYRLGQVFLAGDAAHIHSPAGGQGLNTSVQDAFNLAWKIALVVQGKAPESLLDTYDAERRPVGQHVLRLSDALLRGALVRESWLQTIRKEAFKMIVPLPPVQRLLAENISGLSISYHSAGLNRNIERSNGPMLRLGRKGIHSGDRIADVELLPAVATDENFSLRLYELLHAPGYSLFFVLSSRWLIQHRQELNNLFERLTMQSGPALRIAVLLDHGSINDFPDITVPLYIDFKQQFHHKFLVDENSVLLMRPDGYLAFRLQSINFAALSAALTPWLLQRSSLADLQGQATSYSIRRAGGDSK